MSWQEPHPSPLAGVTEAARASGERLDRLRDAGLLRGTRRVESAQGSRAMLDGRAVTMLCSNNYLGLADHPKVRRAAARAAMRWGAGSGASRLVSGTMEPHEELEARLASFVGKDAALLFGSGFLLNAGVIPALADSGETIFSDELNHASIVDGCRASRAECFVYRHADLEHLAWGISRARGRPALIVSDSLFSMDGDLAPLEGLVELAQEHRLRLMIDEAHAVGCYGPGGRGAVAAAGLTDQVDLVVGTLGKALGSYGAFVASDPATRELLLNAARTFVFSTAPPPPAAAAAQCALELIEGDPALVEQLADRSLALREALAEQGVDTDPSVTHVVPVRVGDPEATLRLCEVFLDRGFFAQAIRPPSVPEGTSRLRLTAMATHEEGELIRAARELAAAAASLGLDLDGEPCRAPLPRAA